MFSMKSIIFSVKSNIFNMKLIISGMKSIIFSMKSNALYLYHEHESYELELRDGHVTFVL